MTTTTRTIGEILTIRRRAAELRVLECATRALRVQVAIEQAIVVTDEQREELAKAAEIKQLAADALALVGREIEAQQGQGEPVVYDPPTSMETRRYAAVLMFDNPALGTAEALAQAHQDESARFEEYYARVHGDEDELAEGDDDEE